MPRNKIAELFDSGMDKVKIYGSEYLISKYQAEKTEKTFNVSIIFPHTNIVHYHNDVYVVKKGILGFKDLSDNEIEMILNLFRYDSDRAKDPSEKKKKNESSKEENNK